MLMNFKNTLISLEKVTILFFFVCSFGLLFAQDPPDSNAIVLPFPINNNILRIFSQRLSLTKKFFSFVDTTYP
jgi:hypothetical protein